MVLYKLVYFNLKARGEVIRLIFLAAGQNFIDERFDFADWPKYKPKTPFGQTPVLEINDGQQVVKLSQTTAIARYLARKFGLAGQNELEEAFIDMYGDQVTDIINELVRAHFEKDITRKKELDERLSTQTWPNNLQIFERRLIENKTGYLIGNQLTWVDLYFFSVLDWLEHNKDSVLDNFPYIKDLDQRLRTHPRLVEYLTNRPNTIF